VRIACTNMERSCTAFVITINLVSLHRRKVSGANKEFLWSENSMGCRNKFDVTVVGEATIQTDELEISELKEVNTTRLSIAHAKQLCDSRFVDNRCQTNQHFRLAVVATQITDQDSWLIACL